MLTDAAGTTSVLVESRVRQDERHLRDEEKGLVELKNYKKDVPPGPE